MTIGALICDLEKARPGSVLTLNDLFAEINRTAMDIYQGIFSRYEVTSSFKEYTDEDAVLDIPENFIGLYKYRLLANIDMNNGDITRYTNNMLLYNNLLNEFSDWYNRNHMPRQKAKLRWV